MKITEIITEAQLPMDQVSATPGMKVHAELQSSDPYDAYKFGVNMGGAPDFHHPADLAGPAGQQLITVAYTDACEAIIDATERAHGVTSKRISPRGSQETADVHKNSTTRKVGPISLNRKTKK
jgi:hypothetical protein